MFKNFKFIATLGSMISIFIYAAASCSCHACNNEITRNFNITSTQMGIMFMSVYFGAIPSTLLSGRIADKRGKLPIVLVGLIFLILGCLGYIFSNKYPIGILSMICIGVGGGCSEAYGTAFVGDIYQGKKRIKMLNFTQTFFGSGAFLGPILVGFFINFTKIYKGTFLTIGILAFLCLILVLISILMKKEKPVGASTEKVPWNIILKDSYLYFIALGIILYCGAELGFSGWVAKYFKDILNTSSAFAAVSVSFEWIGIGLGATLFAFISKKIHPIIMLRIAFSGFFIGFALFLIKIPYVAILGVFLVGFSFGPIFPTLIALGTNKYKEYSGSINSVLFTSACLGGMIFPAFMGYIVDKTSIFTSLYIVFVLVLLNLLMFLFKFKKD